MRIAGVAEQIKVIAVGAASKKGGKSTLACELVRRLGAEYGLKVSTGGTHSRGPLVTDPEIINEPGTDTGGLVESGASKVAWVSASGADLDPLLERAMSYFGSGGLLVAEGNGSFRLEPGFAVFLISVASTEFKPSAAAALPRADLVLVNLESPAGEDRPRIERLLNELAPRAEKVFYAGEDGLSRAFELAVARAGRAVDR